MLAKKKREERAKLVADARAIYDAAEAEKRSPTAEESLKFDTLMASADALKTEVDRLERLDAVEAELGATLQRRAGRENISTDEAKARADLDDRAFKAYLRGGLQGMPPDLRAIGEGRFQNAQGTGSDAAGGYLVPEGFYGEIVSAELAYGAMLTPGLCNAFSTATGNPLPIATDNDTTNEGAILGENTQATTQDVTLGAVILNGPTFTSKIILVSNQLLQDSAFDLNVFLAKKMGIRLGRAKNRQFTIGDGANKPNGVVTAASAGVTTATTLIITPDELLDLEHKVDPAYRTNARYMFHDTTLKNLKKKKDGQGRYIWLPGFATKEPDTINGYPYVVNQHMADDGTSGNKAALFGDFQNYYIRNIGGVMVMRLVERYADFNQTGFVAFERADGNLVDAGTHPIKSLSIL